jgi:hypothetical protein
MHGHIVPVPAGQAGATSLDSLCARVRDAYSGFNAAFSNSIDYAIEARQALIDPDYPYPIYRCLACGGTGLDPASVSLDGGLPVHLHSLLLLAKLPGVEIAVVPEKSSSSFAFAAVTAPCCHSSSTYSGTLS